MKVLGSLILIAILAVITGCVARVSEKALIRPTQGEKLSADTSADGRWTVRVITGYGPESHVGDFSTEAEADKWIATKSKDWPSEPEKLK